MVERIVEEPLLTHGLGDRCERREKVAVMYLGQITELAPVGMLYDNPRQPYTRALLYSVPISHPRLKRKRIILHGDVPSSRNPPPGCRFHPRCPECMDVCRKAKPATRQGEASHLVACQLSRKNDVWFPPDSGGEKPPA